MLADVELPNGVTADSRYAVLAQLVAGLSSCATWSDLARVTVGAFEELGPGRGLRLWGLTSDGWVELSRYPAEHSFGPLTPRDLDIQAGLTDPVHDPSSNRTLVRIELDNSTLGMAEFAGPAADPELIGLTAPVLAQRMKLLAGRRQDGVHLTPRQVDALVDIRKVVREFSASAKSVLPHEHLSLHLMIADGRAFDRYGYPYNLPGESSPIRYEDFGLRHIMVSNEALVSDDLGKDPRLFGRQNRKAAEGGFKGLLSVPLRKTDRPFGVLSFHSRTAGYYGVDDIPIAQQTADQIAVFIEHLRRQKRVWATLRHQIHEAERTRITRDLYYSVAQAAPGISEQAARLALDLNPVAPELSRVAEQIGAMADRMVVDVRRSVNGISPPELNTGDVEEAIARLAERLGISEKMAIETEISGDTGYLPVEMRRVVVRVCCEALLNCSRHSQAAKVSLRVECAQDLSLEIADDGEGFVVGQAQRGDGIGLRHIVELAESVGGYATIASAPGAGTTINFVVPNVRELRSDRPTRPIERPAPEDGPGVLRVLVAAENRITNAGLCRLLERDPELRVVGEIESRGQLQTRLGQLAPDVMLVTTRFCDGDLAAVIGAAKTDAAGAEILVIRTGPALPPADMLAMGAKGVIEAASAERELIDAIRVVSNGVTVIGSACDFDQRNVTAALDAREHLILKLVADGKTNAEIGEQMYLATKTVERQVAAIVRKVGARNRSHAAAIAASQGVIYAHAPAGT